MKTLALAFLIAAAPMLAQDNWKPLDFLKGTWEAKTNGSAGVTSSGNYTFSFELKNHVLSRHGDANPGCKGPADFDCNHSDLFYIYEDAPGMPLKAIYFDNEGHVIHYDVNTPTPTSVIFLSDGSHPGPQFRLTYELNASVMSGKFQMKMPGQTEWKSYLEWSGGKK